MIYETRIHPSRMCTTCFNNHLQRGLSARWCLPRGCLPGGCPLVNTLLDPEAHTPRPRGAPPGSRGTHPLPIACWDTTPRTEFLPHACENITFPQLLLRAVMVRFCKSQNISILICEKSIGSTNAIWWS